MPRRVTIADKGPKGVEIAVERYFETCDKKSVLYGEAGLALHLDVSLNTLRGWYDGTSRPELQKIIQRAYLRIQNQVETHPAYREKGGMATRAIFLLKQKRLGEYVDKVEAKSDMTVNVKMGPGMDESDFK